MQLLQAPPAAGGSSAWALVGTCATAGGSTGTWDFVSNVANVDFTSLSCNHLMVIARGLTASASGFRVLQVSTDNGSTFRSTSGDYISISNLGAEVNQVGIGFHTSAASTGISGIIEIPNIGLSGVQKELFVKNIAQGTTNLFVQSTSPINAIRIASVGSTGNLTAGSIRVLGF